MQWWKQLAAAVAIALSNIVFAADPTDSVNINTASAEMLAEMIHGVGIKRAEAIVRHRDQHGAFASIDELALVRGISAATVEKNRSRITVGTIE